MIDCYSNPDKRKMSEVFFQTLQKADIAFKVLTVSIHHSIDITRKFHEAIDSLDKLTREGKS